VVERKAEVPSSTSPSTSVRKLSSGQIGTDSAIGLPFINERELEAVFKTAIAR
jgi:hypothetical protein